MVACGSSSPKANPDGLLLSCYRADDISCRIEAEIVRLSNEKRAEQGLKPFKQSFESSFAARQWSQQQAQTRSISHQGFPSERQEVIRREFSGLQLSLLAENVAAGVPSTDNPTMIAGYFVELWWNSPGHRQNILGSYQFMGAGIASDTDQGIYRYATQLFH